MIEVPVTKEINEYAPKLIGPLTARQTVCFVPCLIICYFVIRYLRPYVGLEIAGLCCFIPASIAYLFGWAKPYGMKTEKFLQDVFINRFIAPTHRKYKTENTHERVIADAEAFWKEAERANMKRSELRKVQRAEKKAIKQQKHYKLDSSAVK